MRRYTYFGYAIAAYLLFFGVFLYAIGFLGNFLVPQTLDSKPRTSLSSAIAVDLLLLTVFALQHSVMARPAFKEWWTQYIPKPIERATYVVFSCVAMILVFAFWQPLGGSIWQLDNQLAKVAIYSVFGLGWMTIFYSTVLLNHFELFGLRQAYLYLRGKPYTSLPFDEPSLYRYVRHPLYVGWLMAIWATPTMSVSHFVFAAGVTAYIFIAIQFEERDLANLLPGYADYRQRVPMIMPRIGFGKPSHSAAESTTATN